MLERHARRARRTEYIPMVRQRVLFGSLMLVGLLALMAADARLSSDASAPYAAPVRALGFGGLTTVSFTLLVLVGAVELCSLFRRAGHRPAVSWCLIVVVLMMVGPWLASPHGRTAPAGGDGWPARIGDLDRNLPWLAIFGTAVVLIWRQRTDGAIADFAVSLLVMFYAGYLGSFAVRLRCWQPGPEGAWIVFATLAVIKVTDIGAYFTGLWLGRHALIPRISPKKTWEGLIGGILASGIVSWLLLDLVGPRLGWAGVTAGLTVPQAFVFGIVMAIIGQLGDLAESLFKRDCGAKDSARLVPAFGGMLDLIDSPLLAVPAAYWLLRWWLL